MNFKRKIIIILTVLSAIIALFNAAYEFLLPLYISYIIGFKSSGTNMVTKIGEADGPTSIIISNSNSAYLSTVIPLLVAFIGMVYLIISKKKSKLHSSDK